MGQKFCDRISVKEWDRKSHNGDRPSQTDTFIRSRTSAWCSLDNVIRFNNLTNSKVRRINYRNSKVSWLKCILTVIHSLYHSCAVWSFFFRIVHAAVKKLLSQSDKNKAVNCKQFSSRELTNALNDNYYNFIAVIHFCLTETALFLTAAWTGRKKSLKLLDFFK